MIQIPNVAGTKIQAEGLRIVVTDNFIYIDTSQVQQNALMVQDQITRLPRNPVNEPEEMIDRVRKSTNKTTRFFNELFWGPEEK